MGRRRREEAERAALAAGARAAFAAASDLRDRARALMVLGPAEDAVLRDAVTRQLEACHPQGPLEARRSYGLARRVPAVRVALVGPPLDGAGLTVGLRRALLLPHGHVRLHHARDRVPRDGSVSVDEAAAAVLDVVVDDVMLRRAENAALAARLEAWLADPLAARDPAGLARAFPELAPYLPGREPEGASVH